MTIRQQVISLTDSGLSLKEAFLEVSKLRGVQIDSIRRAYGKQTRIHEKATALNVNVSDIKHGWIKDKEASFFFKNPDFKSEDKDNFKDELISLVESRSPYIQNILYQNDDAKYLLVIDPADIHLGKLSSEFETGENYDTLIAVKRVKEGVTSLIQRSSIYDLERIVLIVGNDILHTDTPKRTTTAGTNQDTCGMWYDNFMIGFKLYSDIIELMSLIAPVHVIFNPSNHDFTSGFYLAQMVSAYFSNNLNVTFDCDMKHRKYFVFGRNLIGTTHGDGAQQKDLALLMAHESGQGWADSVFRYWYIHHFHHKIAKDYMSVTVESLRSSSSADGWHHRNGYQYAPKSIEAFIHHKDLGQVARYCHYF